MAIKTPIGRASGASMVDFLTRCPALGSRVTGVGRLQTSGLLDITWRGLLGPHTGFRDSWSLAPVVMGGSKAVGFDLNFKRSPAALRASAAAASPRVSGGKLNDALVSRGLQTLHTGRQLSSKQA